MAAKKKIYGTGDLTPIQRQGILSVYRSQSRRRERAKQRGEIPPTFYVGVPEANKSDGKAMGKLQLMRALATAGLAILVDRHGEYTEDPKDNYSRQQQLYINLTPLGWDLAKQLQAMHDDEIAAAQATGIRLDAELTVYRISIPQIVHRTATFAVRAKSPEEALAMFGEAVDAKGEIRLVKTESGDVEAALPTEAIPTKLRPTKMNYNIRENDPAFWEDDQ